MVHPNDNEKNKQIERTQEQLNNDYATTLAQIGEREFRISKLKEEISNLFSHVDSLQKEAAALAANKPAEVEVPKEATVTPIKG